MKLLTKIKKWVVKQAIIKEIRNMDLLKGKRTVLAGLALIAYAIGGVVLGHLDTNNAVELFLEGAGFIFLRLGLIKEG